MSLYLEQTKALYSELGVWHELRVLGCGDKAHKQCDPPLRSCPLWEVNGEQETALYH